MSKESINKAVGGIVALKFEEQFTVMKKVYIYKAQGITASEPLEPVVIVLGEQVPNVVDLEEARRIYEREAVKLADVLLSTLPGGTFDQLMDELMKRRATLFRVPLFEEKK